MKICEIKRSYKVITFSDRFIPWKDSQPAIIYANFYHDAISENEERKNKMGQKMFGNVRSNQGISGRSRMVSVNDAMNWVEFCVSKIVNRRKQ